MVSWWSAVPTTDGASGDRRDPTGETREKLADPQSGDKQLLWNPEPCPENPHFWKPEKAQLEAASIGLDSPGSLASGLLLLVSQAGAMQSSRGEKIR